MTPNRPRLSGKHGMHSPNSLTINNRVKCMYVCMHVCIYVCMHESMIVCMNVCMYMYIYIYA